MHWRHRHVCSSDLPHLARVEPKAGALARLDRDSGTVDESSLVGRGSTDANNKSSNRIPVGSSSVFTENDNDDIKREASSSTL